MLLREMLAEEAKDVIDLILSQSKLPRSEQSRWRVVDALVKSMQVCKVTEPLNTPIASIALSLQDIGKGGSYPPDRTQFVDRIEKDTKLPRSTICSSILKFPWDIPGYLLLSKHKRKEQEGVVIKKAVVQEATIVETKEPISTKVESVAVKPYHVVIDFGEFKIRIERKET